MTTLLLDRSAWDLTIDASGNIAMASGPYANAQDAASAIKLFKGEYIYDVTLGIPYFEQILGRSAPLNLIRTQQQNAALSVPTVAAAAVFFSSVENGQVSGQVQVKDANGNISVANF